MLELQHVVGGYGDTTVLRDVSLAVPDSSVVALLGPNGAGKTTSLRMASGLLRPRQGSVLLDGADISRLSPFQRVAQGICHIPEGRGIFPSLTVKENVIIYAPRGREKESWERAVDTFPVIGSRRRQIAGTLSGGEQQMLALVRAYISDPRIVLVDEASLGLAPLVVDDIFSFLERIAREGAALLLVEQYVSRALALAETVYLLSQGEIVYAGPAAELDEEHIFSMYTGGTTTGTRSDR
jgi:branched-chain amino acid transport system ATP-binding protein